MQLRSLTSIGPRLLGEVTHFSRYARYMPAELRRESWHDTVARTEAMFVEHYPSMSDRIEQAFDMVRRRQVLPSMRAMQFAGQAANANNIRLYNCCYTPIDDVECFAEVFYLLLSGTGVGYSVQQHHIDKLPARRRVFSTEHYLVEDSARGWSEAAYALVNAYLDNKPRRPDMRTVQPGFRPIFDYSAIRPAGSPLRTSGGYAPGPSGLRRALEATERVLGSVLPGQRLSSLQVHDIICEMSSAVVVGGSRRSSLISLFSATDESMLSSKSGEWYTHNPNRRFANNSAVVPRESFSHLADGIFAQLSTAGSGEPGIFLTNDLEVGTNPCAEISLAPRTFCNLTEINAATVVDQADLNRRATAASFIGSLQAGFTDFPLLRQDWQDNSREDALIGVGMTGIAAGTIAQLDLVEAAQHVMDTNESVSAAIGLPPAARTTTVKPAGTTSLMLGAVSSGVHSWHSAYYVRRITLSKSDPLYAYVLSQIPSAVQQSVYNESDCVLEFPIAAPPNATLRTQESLFDFLERVKRFNEQWVQQGHRRGPNPHNVSATVSVRDNEWEPLKEWMLSNINSYNALSMLPFSDHTYAQTPFEEIKCHEYLERVANLEREARNFDLRDVLERYDSTKPLAESACSGPLCEIN